MKKILVSVGISLIFMILLLMGINMIDDRYHKDAIERLEDNIKKAAMNCYSIEGYYPNDVNCYDALLHEVELVDKHPSDV